MYGHLVVSSWRWLLAVDLGLLLTTNGPSCTISRRATLHNSHLRTNSAQKALTFSGNVLSGTLRNGLQLQNYSNTNGSLPSNHKFQLIQEPRAIVAHPATQTQEAALDKALCTWNLLCLCWVCSSVGNYSGDGSGAAARPFFSSVLRSIRSVFGIRKHQR
jgi:hypothetical protein